MGLGWFLGGGFWKKEVHFTPLSETTLVEDLDDGPIEGLTEADVRAMEWLGVPRYEVCSKKRLKERYGCNEPYQVLRHPVSEYYSYLASEDRRYMRFEKYRFKELACLGFTFEFYKKMVMDVRDLICSLIAEHKDKDIKYWEKEIRLIKNDLRATKDIRLIELAKKVKCDASL